MVEIEIVFLVITLAQSVIIALLSSRIDLTRKQIAGLVEHIRKQGEINDSIVRILEKADCAGHHYRIARLEGKL